jgi:arginase family enzyme
MEYLFNFFQPLNSQAFTFVDDLPQDSLGKYIRINFGEDETEILPDSIVIFNTEEKENHISLRKELYNLYTGNWKVKLFDLGILKVGETFQDTLVILKEITAELVKNNILPVVIGGSQAYTYGLYRAYDALEKRVNLCTIDATFDLGNLNNPIDEFSFLTHIIMNQPNNLFSYTNLGYQTYLNSQDEIHLLDEMMFDTYRLGEVRNNMELTEPILRETDVLSIDLKCVKATEVDGMSSKNINGFTSDEICKIARYAGISDVLNVFGIFGYNETTESKLTPQLVAQMIWYFVEGYHLRIKEFPNEQLDNFKKYNVVIDDDTFTFYQSEISNRWWMEIILKENNKTKRRTLIPCTYRDYLTATRMEIPERWYLNRRKLGI